MESRLARIDKIVKRKYKHLFKQYKYILLESLKFDVVERYYFFAVEKQKIAIEIREIKCKRIFKSRLYSFFEKAISRKQYSLIFRIRHCYGLHVFSSYMRSNRSTVLSNPSLLGLCPLLFDEVEFKYLIINDIKNSGFVNDSFYNISKILTNCFDDSLKRLNVKGYESEYHWKESIITTDYLLKILKQYKLYEEISDLQPTDERLKLLVKEGINKNDGIDRRIVLINNYSQKELIEDISKSIISANVNTTNFKLTKENTEDLRNFIFTGFKNLKGKNGSPKAFNDISFLTDNIHTIKVSLKKLSNEQKFVGTEKMISETIALCLEGLKNTKTIQNL